MTDLLTAEDRCIRGCVWESMIEGEAPRPRPAKHGLLCASCYWRIRHALLEIPDMVAVMRTKVIPKGVANYESERVQEQVEGSPAPLNVDALDASDALFVKLVSWIDDIAPRLKTTAPSIRVWMGMTEPQGMRPVSAKAAHDQASQLVHWFLVRLDTIAELGMVTEFHDDLCWGWDGSPGVYKLTGQYGANPRPVRAADKRECPVCGKREVFVKWPDKFDPDIAVLCGRCKWVAEPEKYDFYAELFRRA